MDLLFVFPVRPRLAPEGNAVFMGGYRPMGIGGYQRPGTNSFSVQSVAFRCYGHLIFKLSAESEVGYIEVATLCSPCCGYR